jgi:uncharacterized membrane protein YfcA
MAKLAMISYFGGVFSPLFGIGSGMIFVPTLLSFNFKPQSAIIMATFISFNSSILNPV